MSGGYLYLQRHAPPSSSPRQLPAHIQHTVRTYARPHHRGISHAFLSARGAREEGTEIIYFSFRTPSVLFAANVFFVIEVPAPLVGDESRLAHIP